MRCALIVLRMSPDYTRIQSDSKTHPKIQLNFNTEHCVNGSASSLNKCHRMMSLWRVCIRELH